MILGAVGTFSATLDRFTDSVIPLGVASSSVRLIVAGVIDRVPEVPDTVIVSSVSSTVSFVGVRTNDLLAVVWVRGIPSANPLAATKSTADAVPLAATETITTVSVLKVPAAYRRRHRDPRRRRDVLGHGLRAHRQGDRLCASDGRQSQKRGRSEERGGQGARRRPGEGGAAPGRGAGPGGRQPRE